MEDNMKKIKLTQGKYAMIDDEDYERVSQYRWFAARNNDKSVFYAGRTIDKKNLGMHRFVLNVSDRRIKVDHINHNTLDNRKFNLRVCSHAENCSNRKPVKGRLLPKGVIAIGKNKYKAQIKKAGKDIHLGYFDSPTEAALAYNKKALELFGEFAYLNKIEGI